MPRKKDKQEIISNKLADKLSKCKCGHTFLIHATENKKICNWCGNYVFRTPKDEFDYRLQEQLKRSK